MKKSTPSSAAQQLFTGHRSTRCHFRSAATTALVAVLAVSAAQANPTGGSVSYGSATITGSGSPSVTINQLSNTAVINWNSFSINSGELTTFVQPSASSAVLNRVTGGGLSTINGTLNANGQVFLINGNGILVGRSGLVNTAGFTASTLNISDSDFAKNNLKFSGPSAASVQNYGTINAASGNIYLIGQTVDNEGAINAANGTVGLAGANSVLITQSGAQHVFVNSTPSTAHAGLSAVTNNGSIAATAAELRAANGNMYALAINNGGTIRAATVQKQGGHVYLTSDSGVIVNTGNIDVSATAALGAGGTVLVKTSGAAVQHGTIAARGGQGGTGGTVELSGSSLDFEGNVDLTSPGGTTGNLLLDPQEIDIIGTEGNGVVTTSGTTTTYVPATGFTTSTLWNATLEAQLSIANVIVDGVNNVTVDAPITWTSGKSLTLETTGAGANLGRIIINQAITGNSGSSSLDTLIINDENNGFVTTGAGGVISVDNFTLNAGYWQQIVSPNAPTAKMPGLVSALPGFTVGNDFQLDGTSTFARFAGGDGVAVNARNPNDAPFQVADLYSLQGIGSPSGLLLGGNYILEANIAYDGSAVTANTIYWNGGNVANGTNGAGFVPIGEGGSTVLPFSGVFDGNNFTIAGYYFYRPSDDLTGLFANLTGTVKNLTVDGVGGQGVGISGVLAGRVSSGGVVSNCFTTIDALVGEPTAPSSPTAGTTSNQSDLRSNQLDVDSASGGLVGEVEPGGLVVNSESHVGYEILEGSSSPSSSTYAGIIGVGGLVGVNFGTVTNSSSDVAGTTSINIQGPSNNGLYAKYETISIGGLVGTNFGLINGGECAGSINPVPVDASNSNPASILSGVGNLDIGGFVGTNYGTVNGTVRVGGQVLTYQAFSTDNILVPSGADVDGGQGSYYVGGFVGANFGSITNAYTAPSIAGLTDTAGNTLAAGGLITVSNNLNAPNSSLNTSGAMGDIAVGGFAGANFGSISRSGSEDTITATGNVAGVANVTTGATTTPFVPKFNSPTLLDSYLAGGFVGLNAPGATITQSFSDPNALIIPFTLDPTMPVPTAAAAGDNFGLIGPGSGAGPLVTSAGNITGGTGYYITGGFAGALYGSVDSCYSAGDVSVTGATTQSNSFYTGGFAGVSSAAITNVYETGNVSSTAIVGGGGAFDETGVVGGLIGQMNGGYVSTAYETGSATGGTTRGGLIGVLVSGYGRRSFWDIDNNPGLNYSGGGNGVLAETTLALQVNSASLAASVYTQNAWNFTTIWTDPTSPAAANFPSLLDVP
jgi:filamentous hemagglutinin family protein